jgi:hypothetical protein
VAAGSKVFASHTSELAAWPPERSYVQAALDAINKAGLVPVDMRFLPPESRPSADVCRDLVRQTQVYVGVIGFRYGSMVPGMDVSYTELEFDTASQARIPRLVVMLRTPPADRTRVDPDRTRIDEFRDRLLNRAGITVAFADTPDSVEHQLFVGLTSLLRGQDKPERPDETPRRTRPWLVAVLVSTAVAALAVASGWWLTRSHDNSPDNSLGSARAGSCLSSGSDQQLDATTARVVDCSSPAATFEVVQRVDNQLQANETRACLDSAVTSWKYVLWVPGSGQLGTVLCVSDLTR